MLSISLDSIYVAYRLYFDVVKKKWELVDILT